MFIPVFKRQRQEEYHELSFTTLYTLGLDPVSKKHNVKYTYDSNDHPSPEPRYGTHI